jgi:cellulose synthase/poly-beta-1,6-N-acetylglucosamine synthase-like glycosyltransferase
LIPAWNEENGVITTVTALLQSTYHNLEIIVIDNASTDNTRRNLTNLIAGYDRIVANARERYRSSPERELPVLRYEYEPQPGKGHALNRGLAAATGDIIMTIDADCSVPPETVVNFVQHFRNPEVMAAVGNVKIGNTQTLIGVVQYLEFLFSFYFKKADSVVDIIYIIGGAAGAVRRSVFDRIGPFSTTNITEDIDLSVRIQDAGMKIVYADDALVYTEGAGELTGLMKQRLRWKRGRLETFSQHRHLFFSADTNHNKLLSWVILPLAIFGEAQLSLELFFLLFLYIYSYLSADFTSFYSGIIVVSSMFFIQAIFDRQSHQKWGFIFLAPIGWLLFYISTFVEFNALVRAVWGYTHNTEVKWQRWKRGGVFQE